MKVSVLGFEGPVAREVRAELERRGHIVAETGAECAIYFPGPLEELERLAASDVRRLVLRSHAYAYGSNPKNPGLMEEDRVSLLPPDAPEQRWLRAEAIAAKHSNWAAVRLTNVLHAGERDLLVRQLAARVAVPPAGHDPNVQFMTVRDAARALVAAAESNVGGVFNAAGGGAVPLKKAFRAAATRRIAAPKPIARWFSGGDAVEQLEYNWTVSGERAARELGYRPERSSVEALAAFLSAKPGARPELLRKSYDDWGLDEGYIRAWGWWFNFLRHVYWRIDCEGMENIPRSGRAMLVASHRGFMPLDAVMHLWLIYNHRQRIPRFLINHILLRTPFLCNFLTKLGGVIASQENAQRLFDSENLVGLFPEGIRGTFSPYKQVYKLRNFSRSGFAKMAIENRAPCIPVAVIGHAEIFPIIGRIPWLESWATRVLGWPYFPIAPMFPLAPVPIPSKWHVRVLPEVPLDGLRPADAENVRLVRDFSAHIQDIIQRNIDEMLPRRKSWFRGRVLDGTAPQTPEFQLPQRQRMAGGSGQ